MTEEKKQTFYDGAKKKYSLPDYSEIDYEFDLGKVDEYRDLKGIRRKISEKLESYCKVIEEAVQPDGSFSSIYETRFYTEKDKDLALKLFRKMMIIYKESIRLNLNFGDEEDAKFIASTYSFWKGIKPELSETLNKLKEGWVKEDDKSSIQDYLG